MVRSQLKVVKADGEIEEYIHTKVIGTISSALSKVGRDDVYIAEQLADVVTYYLYNEEGTNSVTSSEILSIIIAILTETGYENAAEALSEYHYRRKFRRLRTEVVSIDIQGLTDAQMLAETEQPNGGSQWDKSRIVNMLVRDYDFDAPAARMTTARTIDKTDLTLINDFITNTS